MAGLLNLDSLGTGIRSLLDNPAFGGGQGQQGNPAALPFGDFAGQAGSSLWGQGQQGLGQPATSLWGGQQGFGQAPTSLWSGDTAGGTSPFSGAMSPVYGQAGTGYDQLGRVFSSGVGLQNTLDQQAADKAARATAKAKEASTPETVGSSLGTPGGDFGSPSAAVLDGELNGTALAGQGQTILDASARHGIPASALMAIFKQESSYRTPSGANNYGGLRPADGSGGFASYADLPTGIDAVAGNLGSDLYRGLTLSQVINKWAPASDGNDPFAYTNNALDTIHRLGGNATANSVVSQQAPAQPATGGTTTKVTAQGYAFPVQGFQGPVQLHWGQEDGGSDLMAPEGTPVMSLGAGTVVDASPNSLGGNTVTLKLDNGLTVYMAHLRDVPMVKAGQRVTPGQQLGYVGTTGNAAGGPSHLHIGIGNDIISGSGPTGGLGSGFNAVDWLNQILQQSGGG